MRSRKPSAQSSSKSHTSQKSNAQGKRQETHVREDSHQSHPIRVRPGTPAPKPAPHHTKTRAPGKPKRPEADNDSFLSSGPQRLQKFLAQAGVCSRREAESLILSGLVEVNGKVADVLGVKVDPERDSVTVRGKLLETERPVLFRFFKPRNVVSTLSDPENRPCIKDYLAEIPERVYPVGRLDFDAFGLLLLTNDGQFAEHLLHPRYGVERVYWAHVRGVIPKEILTELVKGIELDDGTARAKSAHILERSPDRDKLFSRPKTDSDFVELVVSEGRKHFVKRLLAAVGHPVVELCRIRFGDYALFPLRSGEIVPAKFNRSVHEE